MEVEEVWEVEARLSHNGEVVDWVRQRPGERLSRQVARWYPLSADQVVTVHVTHRPTLWARQAKIVSFRRPATLIVKRGGKSAVLGVAINEMKEEMESAA